ncbi:hypothetical protein J6V85_01335 [Candidatus Saccharibacteria bacterium]|nr:hypothetical protein [Candidatus Saccharibacteria bacterium]
MEKLRKKQKNITWTICIVSFIMIFVSAIIMQMSWYPNRILQGWPMVISILACLCSFIVAINQTANYSKAKKSLTNTLQNQPKQQPTHVPKNNSANSVVSLICAIIPLLLLFITFLSSMSNRSSNTDQSGWILVIYYWTIGIPLFFVWLICGIFGLKSKKRNIAIASLTIKPIGFILIIMLMLIMR